MGRIKFYLFLLSIQVVIAIIVYFSLSSIPKNELEDTLGDSQHVYWSYENERGPNDWVKIDSSYLACGNGKQQSPINIETTLVDTNKGKKIQLDYKPTKFYLENDGHVVKITDFSNNNFLIVDGERYKLMHIHFHHPSEHHLNGISFNMEGHMVHENEDGNITVVGFFIQEGKENSKLAQIWSMLPNEKTEEPIFINQSVNLKELLIKDNQVFTYNGSLTTPPCTEGVNWIILSNPIEMSEEQIELFSNTYPENNRPIQPLNERTIEKGEILIN